MSLIRHAEARRSETPNAVMTTLASPTQGGAHLALWRVEMAPGRSGPLHAMETEQVWTCLEGSARVTLGVDAFTLTEGDTIVLPADRPRQVHTGPDAPFTAIVTALPGGRAYNPGGVTPDGACAQAPRDTDRVLPAWTT